MGRRAASRRAPSSQWRRRACAAKQESQATMSGSLRVKRAFKKVPEQTMMPGRIQSPAPTRFSVKWYGGAMPTQGKSSKVMVMPKFDGLKKCRLPEHAGTRKTVFEAMAAEAANATGQSRAVV